MNKVIIFFVLLLTIATPAIAAEQPPDYCDESWQQWQQIFVDNPQDDSIASLYAFRIGLCSMVRSGTIDTGRATKLFEQLRDTVIRGKLEAEDAGRIEL